MSSHARIQQARELISAGQLSQAKALLIRLAQAAPGDPHVNNQLSLVLARQGEVASALYYAERALAAAPDEAPLLVTCGNLLSLNGRIAEAQAVLRRAVAAAPGDPEARLSLAKAHLSAKDMTAAAAVCEAAARDGAESPEIALLHGAILAGMGRPTDATESLRAAAARLNQHPMILSHLAFTTNFDPSCGTREVLEAHRRYGEALRVGLPPLVGEVALPREPEKRLRIGFVSADFRAHSVAYFLEPLVARLDRGEFEIICYDIATQADAVTARFRALAGLWREAPTHSPHELAALMRRDALDIAIDLAGHSEAHRLAAFRLRGAPVQMTYLGYPATTGVSAIDWRIVDTLTDPRGSEAYMTERPARLDPCFLCYRPPRDAPGVSPRSDSGPVVFGSCAAMGKINERVLSLWANVLAATPGSWLLIKNQGIAERSVCEAVGRALADRGVGADRLMTLPWRPSVREHLSAYGQIDIALDTFPYNGTTTTCEALHMGVPVVSRSGELHAGRVGLSLLSAVGLRELVARGDDEYVAIAAALAAGRARLAALRRTLRERLAGSVLCDEAGYAARFGAMLRRVWRDACAAQSGPA